MDTTTIEQELLSLEKSYWQAIKDRDIETAIALTDDPCIVAGARGVDRVDREQFKRMMTSSAHSLDAFEVKDGAQVRMLSDDVAILAYRVHQDRMVDGKQVSIDAADTSTWVRRDGRWVCALHTEALAGER